MNLLRTCSSGYLLFLIACGCSWENTTHTVAQAPQHLRLSERIWVDSSLRWRLPSDAGIVAVDKGLAPPNWILAANAGLNSIFDDHGQQTRYRVLVDWPNPMTSDEPKRDSLGATLSSFITLPRTAATQVVTVKLFDRSEHFVATMDLHIKPPLLGPDWHDEQVIQASFRHLARTLRDG